MKTYKWALSIASIMAFVILGGVFFENNTTATTVAVINDVEIDGTQAIVEVEGEYSHIYYFLWDRDEREYVSKGFLESSIEVEKNTRYYLTVAGWMGTEWTQWSEWYDFNTPKTISQRTSTPPPSTNTRTSTSTSTPPPSTDTGTSQPPPTYTPPATRTPSPPPTYTPPPASTRQGTTECSADGSSCTIMSGDIVRYYTCNPIKPSCAVDETDTMTIVKWTRGACSGGGEDFRIEIGGALHCQKVYSIRYVKGTCDGRTGTKAWRQIDGSTVAYCRTETIQ